VREPLNFHHLYQFWIVAQEGTLVGAGRRLGIGHSTLSAHIKALELSLGGRLLLRRPRGVRLTPFGEVVRGYCDQIFRLGSELIEATQGAQRNPTRLKVGILSSVPRSLAYEVLRPALRDGTAMPIEVVVNDLSGLCGLLITGRLHVAISDRLPTRPGEAMVYGHLVAETRIGLFGTRRSVERYRPRFPASLDGAQILVPAAGTSVRELLASWFAEEGLRPRIVGEFEDVAMMKTFAAHGHGLVPIRQVLAEEARERYGLFPVGTVPGIRERLYALTLGRRIRHPGVQRLVEQAREKTPA
jgi:LysR family transcriptional activator of nhaA